MLRRPPPGGWGRRLSKGGLKPPIDTFSSGLRDLEEPFPGEVVAVCGSSETKRDSSKSASTSSKTAARLFEAKEEHFEVGEPLFDSAERLSRTAERLSETAESLSGYGKPPKEWEDRRKDRAGTWPAFSDFGFERREKVS